MSSLDIQATEVFEKNLAAKTRIVVDQGGTRSSKTYSILQLFIVEAFERTGIEYDVIRKHMPALRGSAMKDFFDILKSLGLYNESNHNKTENIYRLRDNNFNFYSLDDEKKVRGRKRHKILLNEANEMSYDDFKQILWRTEEQIFMDYNPSDEQHWIYDHVLTREDCTLIISTYLDNPFLPKSQVEEVERLRNDEDQNDWKVYGLGERGKKREIIFSNWDIVDEWPEHIDDILFGLDFGFNDPKVLIRLGRIGRDVWLDEKLYQSEIIPADVIQKLPTLVESRMTEIWADSENPDAIEEIYRAHWNIKPTEKGPGSVLAGIEMCKRFKFHILSGSKNLIRDFRAWAWKKDKNGNILDEPSHNFSHGPDAVRYPIYNAWGKEYRNLTEQDMKGVEFEEMEAVTITANY